MKFLPKNQLAAKSKWSLSEVRKFQKSVRDFRESLNYENVDLARAFDYSVQYVRMMQGDFKSTRQPSEKFIERFNSLRSSSPESKPGFLPVLAFRPDEHSIPMSRVLAALKQCPECVFEFQRGYRDENETWWVMRVPQQKYHSKEHRQAMLLRRRRKSRKRGVKAKKK